MSQITLLDIFQSILWGCFALAPFMIGYSRGYRNAELTARMLEAEGLRRYELREELDSRETGDVFSFCIAIAAQIALLIAVYKAGGKA